MFIFTTGMTMLKPDSKQHIEVISERVRIAHDGEPPFLLEFWHQRYWTHGVQYDDLNEARAAAKRIAITASGK